METVIQCTKEQLVDAFKKWNQDYLNNPDGFEEITEEEDIAILQADELIRRISS